MKVGSRIFTNFSAFIIGMLLTGAIIFLVIESGTMTASVADSFVKIGVSDTKDVSLSIVSGSIFAHTNRVFVLQKGQSFRIEFQYDTNISTHDRNLSSHYPHSFTLQNGIATLLISPGDAVIAKGEELFQFSTSISDYKSLPILTMFSWYGSDFIESLLVDILKDNIHY